MAADVRVVWMPGGIRTEIHLGAEDTDGAFCLLVDHPPTGWSLPPHRHHEHAETIHVVAGQFEMVIEGARSSLSEGQTVHIPPGVVHSGANVGSQIARRVLLFSPGGMERFFLEAGGQAPGSALAPSDMLASAARYGWEFIDER